MLSVYHNEYKYLQKQIQRNKIFFILGDNHVGKKYFILSFINSDIKTKYSENISIAKIEGISEKIFSSTNIIIVNERNISKFTLNNISYYTRKIMHDNHIKALFFIISSENTNIPPMIKCFMKKYPNIYLTKITPYTGIADLRPLAKEKKCFDANILFITHGRIGTFFYLKNFNIVNNFLMLHKFVFNKETNNISIINENIDNIIRTDVRVIRCLNTYIDDIFYYMFKFSQNNLYKSDTYFMFSEIKLMTEYYNITSSNIYISILQNISRFLIKNTNAI